ncbi:hypothetical protein [Pedobacter sp. SYP-B3415]|uniref:hypothetical protein n=1 Tax=Pedobacter sp. SYP-B3415 TaxID=2496641 RepID=UPI00101CDF83|nr:hypothetical protein [Pedobacter sp. SYP-B3415]
MTIEVSDHQVFWELEGKSIDIKFRQRIFQAQYVPHTAQVIIIADYRETGPQNLFVYNICGELVSKPEMPSFNAEILGVYSIWYVAAEDEQTIVLSTSNSDQYDVKCTFNLRNYTFSDVSLTR